MHRTKRKLIALFLGTLISLLTAEGILRYQALDWQGRFIFAPALDMTFDPDPAFLAGIHGSSRLLTTADGLRARQRPAGEHMSILCLGGSTTECLYLDQAETWPALLGTELAQVSGADVWVANAGKSGASARHHLMQLDAVLERQSNFDWVVLMAGVNDLGSRLRRDKQYDPNYTQNPAHQSRLNRLAFQLYRPNDAVWYERSALWMFLRRARLSGARAGDLQDRNGSVYGAWREQRRSSPNRREELPDLTSALEEYRRNLVPLIERCRLAGAQLLLLTQPVLWRADLEPELEARLWLGGVGSFKREKGCDYYTPSALASGMRAFDEALLALGRENDVPVLDLGFLVERSGAHFYDDCHFTEAGAREVARLVSLDLAGREPFAR